MQLDHVRDLAFTPTRSSGRNPVKYDFAVLAFNGLSGALAAPKSGRSIREVFESAIKNWLRSAKSAVLQFKDVFILIIYS
jgi:hypothetical protein